MDEIQISRTFSRMWAMPSAPCAKTTPYCLSKTLTVSGEGFSCPLMRARSSCLPVLVAASSTLLEELAKGAVITAALWSEPPSHRLPMCPLHRLMQRCADVPPPPTPPSPTTHHFHHRTHHTLSLSTLTADSIYRDDLTFKDPNLSFHGLKTYRAIFWGLRLHGKLLLKAANVRVLRIWQPEDAVIK